MESIGVVQDKSNIPIGVRRGGRSVCVRERFALCNQNVMFFFLILLS